MQRFEVKSIVLPGLLYPGEHPCNADFIVNAWKQLNHPVTNRAARTIPHIGTELEIKKLKLPIHLRSDGIRLVFDTRQ